MLSEETLQALQCAMSSDSHFVKQPLSLSCGHSVCKKCVPATEKKQLKCKLCGEINQIELDKLSESRAIKQLLKAHFDQLFDIIVARFETSLTNLRGMIPFDTICKNIKYYYLEFYLFNRWKKNGR